MEINFDPYFKRYKQVAMTADALFEHLQEAYPESVTCHLRCADCCHALFDLTLIEAIYINKRFNAEFEREKRDRLLERCNRVDRQVYRLKRKAYRELEAGKEEIRILAEMAGQRMRCPMLSKQDVCEIYEFRPVTCRLYGIPTRIGGNAHTCGLSGFREGQKYPTVSIDKIQNQLYAISADLVSGMKTKHMKMADMLVPLSMAILTVYDNDTLGISTAESETAAETEKDDG